MKNVFIIIFVLLANWTLAQSNIQFKGTSLRPGDSCTIILQQSAELYFEKKLIVNTDSTVNYTFSNISNGKWALKIDATGYYYPAAKVFDLNNNSIVVETKFVLIKLANSVDYIYQWQDDSSYVGHAQQSYINTPLEVTILNKTIKIPDDFSSVNLYSKFGFVLSNEISSWNDEDAYRLFQIVSRIPLFSTYGEGNPIVVNSVWKITDEEVIDDIRVELINGVKFVTVSRKAFVYANPAVVLIDGVKGKFFSKRLHHAVLAFATDFGYNKELVNKIAKEKFGFSFLVPGQELKNLMNEDYSNFQEFSAFEKLTVLDMIEEMPEGMHAQTNLKYLVRRIAGQVNPKYPNAAAIAWTGIKTIEFMNSAFQGNDLFNTQKLVLHEKAHFLWDGLFDQKLKDDWADLGGWYIDPTVSSGWSTTKTTEFVSAYSHANNPNEDMAESIAFYVLNPDMLMSRSIRKFEFIRDRIMQGTRYVAMIRKDLTFMVYNLFPDYNYPGKIKRVNVNVKGEPNEDKIVTLEIELNIIDSIRDVATQGYTRFMSSSGTIFDIGLSPIDSKGYILRGSANISKFFKNGYWYVNQIMVADAVGNKRFENNNTFGLKLFLNNPLEDLLPPIYIDNTLKLGKGTSKFSGMGPNEDTSGFSTQFIESKFDLKEKNQVPYIGIDFAFPKLDENGVKSSLQLGVLGSGDKRYYNIDTLNNEIKHILYRYPIPEYFPKGYYEVTLMRLVDEGGNPKNAFFMNDTSTFRINVGDLKTSKHVRDSIFIDTKYPDFIPPVLDVNAISITATPTNPQSPDGETLFEMEFFAKDSSLYVGNEAGVKHGGYILRDPQGKQHSFSMQDDFNNIKMNFYYLVADPDGKPGFWRKYKVSTLLPKGSSPGLWGVESIDLIDRANNTKHYNFVELVRFDIEEKDSAQRVNPVVEILGKKVNAKNVDSVAISISCKSCVNKIYRMRLYSDMGGESVVYEGVMNQDSIVLKNISLKGVNDGVLYATVFMLDTSKILLGIGKAIYTKDVVSPRSAVLKTNLSNIGKSNVDSLIIDIQVSELSGNYKVAIKQSSIVTANNESSNSGIKSFAITSNATKVGDSIIITGKLVDSTIKLSNIPLSQFEDGLIEFSTIFIDSVGNESAPVIKQFYKDTKSPVGTINKIDLTDLKATYSIDFNENLSNSLTVGDIIIQASTIDSLIKVTNRSYKIYFTRTCTDTVSITLKANTVLDTVGNVNSVTSLIASEKLIPSSPEVKSIAYCEGAVPVALTAINAPNNKLLWYDKNPSGGTYTITAPVPKTNITGTTDYYVSQSVINTGCESVPSKLTVTVYPIPVAPSLSRDVDNYLVSSFSIGNIWYKDGKVLNDTSQKLKPTVSGLYTVKSNINGCMSLIGGDYYFLVTDIMNLSASEFIKLAPNPFVSQLNFDFFVKGYQKLNIEVFELSSGSLVFSKQGIYAGTPIQLGQLSSGMYIVKVSSGDGKLSYQFKMVKM